jgi:hypothetical protein
MFLRRTLPIQNASASSHRNYNAHMVGKFLRLAFVAGALIWIAPLSSLLAQSQQSPSEYPTFVFLIPEGFRGWACVDFSVAGAPPLPREGKALVIRPREGEVLATSDKAPTSLYGEGWIEANGQRTALPENVSVQSGVSRTGSAEPSERSCAFVGTTDERDAAEEAPGFERRSGTFPGVPPRERGALEALYKATGGDKWNHRAGWLGPVGTECTWHGVICARRGGVGVTGVIGIDLFDNNLVGTIPNQLSQLVRLQSLNLGMNRLTGAVPPAVGQLKELDELWLSGNEFSGLVPALLIQKFLAGSLTISVESPRLTDVSEIDFQSQASAVLCANTQFILRSDDSILSYSERCQNATPDDRTTFCEVKAGKIWGFAMLAWLIERNGFFHLASEYSRNVTDGTFENTRVVKAGISHAISNYAEAGPFELWTIQRAIEGVASSAEWEKTTTQPLCPK